MTVLRAGNKTTEDRLSQLLATPSLALDPGETTGVALWVPAREGVSARILLQQWDTKGLVPSFEYLEQCLTDNGVKHLRYEDYKVYEHKARDHVNNSLHTAQWIGGIRICAGLLDIPTSCKMAQQAKSFWTDEKLKMCEVYEPGMKHARDALRHLLFLFLTGI